MTASAGPDIPKENRQAWRPTLHPLSQIQFAALIGISPRNLQKWEQGHRRPEGIARALLRVAESHPQAVLEALHR